MATEESFGQWLRRLRRVNDLTQALLAQQINCSVVTIRKIEADERRPSREMAERLAACLRIPVEERAAFVAFARSTHHAPLPPRHPISHLDFAKSTLPRPGDTLPVPPTSLIGREHEVTAARNSLLNEKVRLLTLIGPPGIGKTRLGAEVAARLQDAFADGIYTVMLGPLSNREMVIKAIAQALGVKETEGTTLRTLVANYLYDKSILLVLDNFEHVLSATPDLATLLSACRQLKLLVTSRAALHLQGEWQFPVPPLMLPDLNQLPPLESLLQYTAVALFVERAQAIDPKFVLTQENASSVVSICAHVDGLPLAIELAAAWSRLFSPQDFVTYLKTQTSLLLDSPCDLPARHKTLRAALDWSYDLLTDGERRLLLHVAVFVDGGTLAAIETVYSSTDTAQSAGAVLQQHRHFPDLMVSLIDKSLVLRRGETDGQVRVTMLETIRNYVLEQLEKHPEAECIRKRHAGYYLTVAEAAESQLRGAQQLVWLQRLEKEHNNLRAALEWALTRQQTEIALRLCAALWRFWEIRGHVSEGRKWLDTTLEQSRLRLQNAGDNFELDRAAYAKVLNGAGKLAVNRGESALAQTLCEESLAIWRALEDEHGLVRTLHTLGIIARYEVKYGQATELFSSCLDISRRLGDRVGTYLALYNLAELALAQGDYGQVVTLHEESLALKRAQGDMLSVATSLSSLAQWAEIQGDYVRATTLYKESLLLCWQQGDPWGMAQSLRGLAAVAAVTWQPARAARLFGAVERLLKVLGASLSPSFYTRTAYERDIAVTHGQLGSALFSELWAEGAALPFDQVLTYALDC